MKASKRSASKANIVAALKDDVSPAKFFKGAKVCHEATRSQYLARTGGCGPVGSKLFKYEGIVDQKTVESLAAKWLQKYLVQWAA